MRKLFSLFALVSLLFAACESVSEETHPSAIKLSKSVVEFDNNGGTEIVEFVIENAKGGNVTAEESADWLEAAIDFNAEVYITADANDGEAREANITLNYEHAKSVVITVKQLGANDSDYDVEFVAKRFEGIYFGTEYSSVPNYYVILSDIGAASDGSPKANGTYYFFDFYRNVKADEESPILPNGNYTYDTANSHRDLTFSEEGSWYAVMDAKGEFAKSGSFKVAEVTVTDGKFEAVIELTSGQKHHVVFEGLLQTTIGHVLSTFTDDVEWAVDGATVSAKYYGDSYEVGYKNWFVEAKKGNDLYMVELFNSSTTSPDGLYQMLPADGKDYADKYIPGMIGNEGLVGSWYAKLTDNTIKGDSMAPMRDGIIRITTDGDTLTIEYSCKDDAGNNITGSVKGSVTISDESNM